MATIGTPDDAILEELVRDATAAPSMHNAQPWRFHYHRAEHALDLRADSERAMPTADPQARAVHIGCGAALLNLRAAAWHEGIRTVVRLLPDPQDPWLMASVRLEESEPRDVDYDLAGLQGLIDRRHTSRYPYAEQPIPHAVRSRLAQQARAEGAALFFPTGWHLSLVLDVIEESELALEHGGDPDEEEWVRRGIALSDTAADGIPEHSLGPRKRSGRAPVRDFARGRAETDRGSADFEHMPQLGLIATDGDHPHDWLMAGQAMERVLLLATREGLASSFATQALERADLRWLLRDPVSGAGPVQMVLRLGYGPTGPHTPRRAVRDVLDFAP